MYNYFFFNYCQINHVLCVFHFTVWRPKLYYGNKNENGKFSENIKTWALWNFNKTLWIPDPIKKLVTTDRILPPQGNSCGRASLSSQTPRRHRFLRKTSPTVFNAQSSSLGTHQLSNLNQLFRSCNFVFNVLRFWFAVCRLRFN